MKRPRWFRQGLGLLFGLLAGGVLLVVLLLPSGESYHARGPMNVGHEDLSCNACHAQAPGTVRQQVQANVKYLLGMRSTGADFGFTDVGNTACLKCHERPNDRHPVFRFVEPRFVEARNAISPQRCESCHLEHQGRRVTIEAGYCSNCHSDLDIVRDPIDVAHVDLVAEARWDTCLGCHDFHGNHVMTLPTAIADAIDPETIDAYFLDAPSPYSETKYFTAKKEEDSDES